MSCFARYSLNKYYTVSLHSSTLAVKPLASTDDEILIWLSVFQEGIQSFQTKRIQYLQPLKSIHYFLLENIGLSESMEDRPSIPGGNMGTC